MNYPPPLSEKQVEELIGNVKDYQLTHGSLLKIIDFDEPQEDLAQPVGVSLFPTLFPKTLFDEALALMKTYNKLYVAVAEDGKWLHEALKDLIECDILASVLWGIHEEIKTEGYAQDLTLGISRSDYMLHMDLETKSKLQIKQVEFNTVACAGGVHGNIVSDMHRYLHTTGAYEPQEGTERPLRLHPSALPPNSTLSNIVSGLSTAHTLYGLPKSPVATKTCILMVVQPNNFNIADERPIEYALHSTSPPTPVFRIHFGHEVLTYCSLTPTRELLYRLPNFSEDMEVSVVYFRAGFEVEEYDEIGRDCRILLERSRAVKCPSVLSHLTTFKKVQQELAREGVLERFLVDEEVARVRETFMPMFPMDDSEEGRRGRELAMDGETAGGYVLKPSLEGGGHNVHGEAIPMFLAEVPREEWGSYILMEKIRPPRLNNILISARGVHEGGVVSELGAFGVCIWRKTNRESGGGAELVHESRPSWSFKTKDESVNEMSVVKGYGCFDSPALVDLQLFEACCQET